jgi:hypothetical protein
VGAPVSAGAGLGPVRGGPDDDFFGGAAMFFSTFEAISLRYIYAVRDPARGTGAGVFGRDAKVFCTFEAIYLRFSYAGAP